MSVDLDYNYIRHLDRDGMLAGRPKVNEALVDMATRRGYTVQASAAEHAGQTLFLATTWFRGNCCRCWLIRQVSVAGRW